MLAFKNRKKTILDGFFIGNGACIPLCFKCKCAYKQLQKSQQDFCQDDRTECVTEQLSECYKVLQKRWVWNLNFSKQTFFNSGSLSKPDFNSKMQNIFKHKYLARQVFLALGFWVQPIPFSLVMPVPQFSDTGFSRPSY